VPAPALEPLVAWGRQIGLEGDVTDVARRPWSTTARVGDVWLKACGTGGRYEVPLLSALGRWRTPHVVHPRAVDVDRGYVALPDAGRVLRELAGATDRWPELLAQHAALQRGLQHRAEEAVALGVPDLRPGAVPALVEGLTSRLDPPADLRRAVLGALPELAADCDALAGGPVAPSLQHDDLHAGNVLVDAAGTARLVDWGDCSVAHPFGVLLVTLRVLRHRAGLGEPELGRLQDAYLEGWSDLADRRELRDLAGRAQRVQAVGRALSWERALQEADDDERAPFDDPVAGWLEVLVGRE
jgi:hypothetical protein